MAGDFTRWLANETAATLKHDLPRPADPASALDVIRAHADMDGPRFNPGFTCDVHVPRLLAAIEALSSALRTHRHTFTERGTEICGGCLRPECPDSPEAIITTALAAQEHP